MVGFAAQLQAVSQVRWMKGWKVFRNEAFFLLIKLFLLMGEVGDGTKALLSVFHRNLMVSVEREAFMTRKKGRGICDMK